MNKVERKAMLQLTKDIELAVNYLEDGAVDSALEILRKYTLNNG